jgi:hypothetical protein
MESLSPCSSSFCGRTPEDDRNYPARLLVSLDIAIVGDAA